MIKAKRTIDIHVGVDVIVQQKVSSIKIPIDKNPDIELIHVAAQSTRLQILNLLLSSKNQKMYSTQIEKNLGI